LAKEWGKGISRIIPLPNIPLPFGCLVRPHFGCGVAALRSLREGVHFYKQIVQGCRFRILFSPVYSDGFLSSIAQRSKRARRNRMVTII
jgi:hypothetical protein